MVVTQNNLRKIDSQVIKKTYSPEELTRFQKIIDTMIHSSTFTYTDIQEVTGYKLNIISKAINVLVNHGWVENLGSSRKPIWKVHKVHLICCDHCGETIRLGFDGGFIKDSMIYNKDLWLHNRCLNPFLEGDTILNVRDLQKKSLGGSR